MLTCRENKAYRFILRWMAIFILMIMSVSTTDVGAQTEESVRKGVFTGDHVGCALKPDLMTYYDANEAGDTSVTNQMEAQNKCVRIMGRAYVPLRIGFVTAHVRIIIQGAEVELWVRTAAVVESPPLPRETHTSF